MVSPFSWILFFGVLIYVMWCAGTILTIGEHGQRRSFRQPGASTNDAAWQSCDAARKTSIFKRPCKTMLHRMISTAWGQPSWLASLPRMPYVECNDCAACKQPSSRESRTYPNQLNLTFPLTPELLQLSVASKPLASHLTSYVTETI